MRRNVVVVADDDAARRQNTVKWLTASGIEAYPQDDTAAGQPVMSLIRELRPRLVLCRPGSTGMAMFYPLRHMKEPPMIVMVAENAASQDEVHYDERLIVASIRTPVQMASLCRFIAAALTITARLDDPEEAGTAALLIHPAVERFVDPEVRAARSRATGAR